MKSKIISLYCFLGLFVLFSLNAKAQPSTCGGWQPLDASFQVVPFSGYSAPYYKNDDGHSNPISLPFSFCFYGTSVNQIVINNNGFITWGTNASSVDGVFDPIPFPNSDAPMISPFWGDVYTLSPCAGVVWYKITSTYVIVIWDSVGYYLNSSSSQDNSFEAIITNGTDPIVPGNNNIELGYLDEQWAVGTASGGTAGFGTASSSSFDYPAVVGINKGDGTNAIQYGLFNNANNNYAGTYPPFSYDGAYWLDNRYFIMNACTGNSPPVISGLVPCGTDTFYVCEGDTLKVPINVYSPISGVTANSGLSNPVISGVSIGYNNSAGQLDSLVIQVVGNASNLGYSTVNFYGYDNLAPHDTTFDSFVIDVSQGQAINISSVTNVSCNSGINGSATVAIVSGGISPYTYAWTAPGGTGATGTGFLAGTYTVTVTDSKGCVSTASVTITQPTAITVTATSTPATCGNNNGTLTASVSGGTPAYTYLWNPSGNTNMTATGMSAGTYTIIVIDNDGCTGTYTTSITNSVGFTANISSSINVSCYGGSNGSATVITSSVGIAPYTYSWNPAGGTSATGTGLTAGTYTVSVTDNSGCTGTATVTVTQPTAITSGITTVQATCGNSNGTASVSVSGGVSPYTYAWSPVGQTNATATGLSTGTYTVTISDNNGCTQIITANITSISSLTATIIDSVGALCSGGDNGRATVSAASGNSPYTYSWSATGGTGSTGTGLSAGTYTVTVTDNGGCTAAATVTITEPPPLTAPIGVITNELCNGGTNGSATVTAGGGVSPYSYIWASIGGTNATGTGFSAGTYTVTITDNNLCTATASVTITEPPAISLSTTSTTATCGNNNGTATVNSTGGTLPYTYLWSSGGQTNPTATGLTAGNYTITITDNNNCTQTSTVAVSSTSNLTVTITDSTGATCNGGSDGTSTVSTSGGTSPYTYSWVSAGGTNAMGTGLSAGTYTVTVTDNGGCTAIATVTITEPPPITPTISASTNEFCNGGTTGSATVNASGGTSPYTYSWVPAGGTNATGTGLSAGTYTITVTDNGGCTAIATVTITEPPVLTATMGIATNELCNGGTNGAATVTAAGGTPAYTYTWAPAGGSNATGTGFSAGTYTVTLTDNNGCMSTASVTITGPAPISLTTSSTQATCGVNNGTVGVIAANGTSPYTYLWATGGQATATATGLSIGIYTITVTDNNGCIQTATAIVTSTSGLAANISTSTNVSCNGGSDGSATVNTTGGTSPYTYAWAPAGGSNATGTGLGAGTYTVTVTDNGGCTAVASVTITEPPILTAAMGNPTNLTCNGANNGSAIVTASGGTSAYTYSWAPTGGANATANNLSAGTYTVTITDNNGCTATATVTITEPPPVVATMGTPTDIACNGGTNGSATVSTAGGSVPYTYNWVPTGGSTATAGGLSAGTYSVTITDNNGCSSSATVTITQPVVLSVTLTTIGAGCSGTSGGSITATAAGGASPYIYTWSPSGGNAATASNLSAGSYTVNISDANGCTVTASATINAPSALSISASGPATVCSGASASLSSTVTGGGMPYTYSWSSGATTSAATVNPATTTTYTLVVTDGNGCSATATVSVATDPPLNVSITGATSFCPGDSGMLSASASGGDGIYNFLWLPGNNTHSSIFAVPASTTVYTVQLTDACGSAMATATATIYVNANPVTNFEAVIPSGCVPLCVEFRDLSTVAGGAITQWDWSFGRNDTTSSKDPIYCYQDSGTFSVSLTVTSDSGCRSTLVKTNIVTVYPLPNANFTYSPDPVDISTPTVQFASTGNSSKYPLVYWHWAFGDGSDSTSYIKNPEHTYTDTGTYCVTLTVENQNGCLDSATNCLVVEPDFTLYIPNAFTPNQDGLNEVFIPKGTYVKDYDMYIFDRWEAQIFHSSDMKIGWNGEVNGTGAICQQGTYLYLIKVTDSRGKPHSYTGMVNLVK